MGIKKQIYQLMEMDYYQYIRKNESTDKSEALNLAKKRRNIHKEILKERESARNEEERNIIKKYINSNQESQMTSREYRYIQEPEFAELFDWCKMNYKKYRPEIDIKSTHNRRERPVCGHRGRSRGPFYYRITTFGKGPWDARDPHKTTFMALKHVIRLSIWQRQKETPGVEKAPGGLFAPEEGIWEEWKG